MTDTAKRRPKPQQKPSGAKAPAQAAAAKPIASAHSAARAPAPARAAAPAKTVSTAPARSAHKNKLAKPAKTKTRTITSFYTIMADTRYSFPVAAVLIALGFTILILAIVTSLVRINDISSEISSLKSELSAVQAEENELHLLLETRDDLRVVESKAKEEYGMVKADQVERYYLTTENSDRIELIEDTKTERSGFMFSIPEFFGSIIERIRTSFGW